MKHTIELTSGELTEIICKLANELEDYGNSASSDLKSAFVKIYQIWEKAKTINPTFNVVIWITKLRKTMTPHFYRQDGIGTAKYTVSYHNGTDKHKDGSPFYGIALFKNKKRLDRFVNQLTEEGYEDYTGRIL